MTDSADLVRPARLGGGGTMEMLRRCVNTPERGHRLVQGDDMGKLPRWSAEVKIVVAFKASDEDSAESKLERIEQAMREALVGHRAPTTRAHGVPAGGAVVIGVDANWESGAIMPLEDER